MLLSFWLLRCRYGLSALYRPEGATGWVHILLCLVGSVIRRRAASAKSLLFED